MATSTSTPAPFLQLPFKSRYSAADDSFRPDSWPITQLFNDPRTRPFYEQDEQDGHEGIDWGCCSGTPIHAMTAGCVTRVDTPAENDPDNYPYGNQVRIRTNWETADGFEITYAHLAVVLVKLGDCVSKGELIGVSGNTGNSTGPHLHVHYKPRDPDDDSTLILGCVDFKDFLEDRSYLMKTPGKECPRLRLRPADDSPVPTFPTVYAYSQPVAATDTPLETLTEAKEYAIVGKDYQALALTPYARPEDPNPWQISPRTPPWWQIEVPGRTQGYWVENSQDVEVLGDVYDTLLTYFGPRLRWYHPNRFNT